MVSERCHAEQVGMEVVVVEHECSHGDRSIWNSEYSVSDSVDLLIVGDVEAWSGRSVGICSVVL